ncbi:ABC transporter permease [Sphingopyxis sp. H071]|uniref:ABC transporter permease n=1 Tax=unclassified Sphingopyxis TaxID=2614943 RepID=UPI0007309746|nr:ABC transporter permease [Sphingopyxis sp. H057]KTE53101.1 ABC transporter permease [Sphingopyxis sp. H073]KTE55290.1 ABC transporter permease [Sphingopyxis sp. H071]KTE59382.1 ABC transporter permease [Sphingopyxis sp. H107]KTE64186.1 ABC transporter permease [Sphingopyxis sp. H100]KTE72793.1 ABC transporter permease [Sphingopyxis sp. H081]KTE80125.1 ABC transporter permease [Sphingopyxis sp. H067]
MSVLPLATLWRIARRDLATRIRGLRLLAVCLFLGVATLAAIGSLTSGITSELERRGQTILGGDIEFSLPQREASAEEMAGFRSIGAPSATVRLRAMANAPGGDALLSELKGVDGAYPLYGTMRLESGARKGAPPAGSIWIGKDLASRLGLKVGGAVKFGEKSFKIDGIIAEEPDRLGEGFTLGPVAIIGLGDLPATQLIQPGSLYESKYRVRLPASANPDAVGKALSERFPDAGWDITDSSNGAPGTRRFIERMGQFLSLVGLAALVIAGIGVGNGVASYLAGKRPGLATLKVLGADSAVVLRIYGLQILAVAAASITAGLVVGALMPSLIGAVAGDVLPVRPGFALYPLPLIVSAAYGLLIAIAFALPPLAATRHVPAAGLYRATVDGGARIDRRTIVSVGAALAAIITLAVGTAREPLFALSFIGAAIGLLLILVALGWLVRRTASRVPRPKRPLLRLAVANLHRPGAATGALVVALGLGLTLFVTLAAIQTSITAEIARTVPQRAPSFFVLDIPRGDAPKFRSMIVDAAPDAQVNMIPALRGSVTEYKGQRVDELAELPEGAWVLRGDRGLTYSPVLPNGSELVGGKWWAADYKGPPLVSVEQEVAASLGLKLGDTLSVNVLGVEVQAKVASFRTVEWDNFGLNYVLVFSPGTFDAAPHNMVATVAVPPKAEVELARSIPRAFPSASLIQVRDVVSQVTTLLTQMSQAIAAAASIAILAGIAVLIGAIAASRERRVYDSVILKLLGATRGQILGAQAMEYAVLAGILALLALGLGLAGAWYVVTQLFDFRFAPDPLIVGLTLVGGAGLSFVIGIAGSWPLLSVKPAQALRSL